MSTGLPSVPTPATAVEVVTSLGGSIVSVDTLTASPTARRRGGGFLVAGGVMLAVALATFGYGVAAAHRDAAARERWLAEKRPGWAFRPTRHGAGADLAALAGALVGLGLVATGLLRRGGTERTRLRVGQNDGVDIPLADAPPERVLVQRDGGGFITPIDGLDGDVRFAGTGTTLASMRAAGHVALPLYVGTQVRTQIGRASFFVRGIDAPARSAPPSFGWDQRVLAFVAASATAHLGLWALVRTVPPSMVGAPTDTSAHEDTSLRAVSLSAEDPDPPPPEDGETDDSGMEGSNAAPTAIALETGTLGRPTPNANPARLRVQDRGVAPTLSRQEAIEMAKSVGILSSSELAGPIAALAGGDLASGFDDIDITGGLFDGGGEGAPAGSFGWGLRGQGTGCGTIAGVACSGVASSPFATIGVDGGDRYTGPIGDGGRGLRRHVNAVPRVVISKPTTCSGEGDASCLDPQIIRRYIKRNIEKIRYCYESELLANPGLEGTVTAEFLLSASGQVLQSRASGVDPKVSSCIATVVSNINFPKMAASGVFPIRYPFQLHRR